MSKEIFKNSGPVTEKKYTALFDIARVPRNTIASKKPYVVKLSPTTEVWAMVREVSKALPTLSPAKVVRLLIRVGYAAFIHSQRERGKVK